MKVVGITAEYNPFHRGHLHHLRRSLAAAGEESAAVVVLSGDFVQRGKAAVFSKFEDALVQGAPHVVLHHPSDQGNVGTILRTALGFGVEDVALIRPCVDVFDPRVVRSSMGSLFSLRVKVYEDFDAYLAEHPDRMLYPFMLDGSRSLPDVLAEPVPNAWTLVFGNEGSGLPP